MTKKPSRLYRLVLWISEKGLADIESFQTRFTLAARAVLAKIDKERLEHDVAVGDQWEELVELELLKSTMLVKEIAEKDGGFSEEHGPALEIAANALYEHCGWDDEDITDWFGGLVMGEGFEMGWEDIEDE